MPTTYPTTLKDLQDCYSLGSMQRFHKCVEESSKSTHLQCYGVMITNPGCGGLVRCCVPLCNPAAGEVVSDKNGNPKKNSHQHRIPNKDLKNFEKTISGLTIPSFTDFEKLYDWVASHSGLKVKHCLLVYDFCLRYGYSIGTQPKDWVYLFQGARTGAEALFGVKIKDFRVSTSCFRPEFPTTFESRDIEDFLCVCKDHIRYIRQNHPSFLPTGRNLIYKP